MKKIALILIIFLLGSNNLIGQEEFKLCKKYKYSDINYLTIKNINGLEHGFSATLKHFEPVKGQYNVYIFIKEFQRVSIEYMDSENSDILISFHDMIILKTNKKNEILDAFFYRLEWAEVPSQYMLFRSFCEPLKLNDNLSLKALNFLNEYEIYSNQETPKYEDKNEFGQRILKSFESDILKL